MKLLIIGLCLMVQITAASTSHFPILRPRGYGVAISSSQLLSWLRQDQTDYVIYYIQAAKSLDWIGMRRMAQEQASIANSLERLRRK